MDALPHGRLDIHSHLIPGIDDGCRDLEESIASIEALRAVGYVGSICTPHIWVDTYPQNTIEHIRVWTDRLIAALGERGIDYRLWPGGELRLHDGVIDSLKCHGVPTLAGSRCVLVDLWVPQWNAWIERSFDWLVAEGYQPILAHPERMGLGEDQIARLHELADQGVMLQGNFNCMTGEDGYLADQHIRRWLTEDRYTFLATDLHRPETRPSRLDGLAMVESEFGRDHLDRMIVENPRRLIFGVA